MIYAVVLIEVLEPLFTWDEDFFVLNGIREDFTSFAKAILHLDQILYGLTLKINSSFQSS